MKQEEVQNKISSILEAPDETKQYWDMMDTADPEYMVYSPKPVGYHDTNEQLYLFQNLLVGYNPQQSILDIGCGRADLYNFIENFFEEKPVYAGVDHNPLMAHLAEHKYGINIQVGAFESAKLTTHDWVVASGLFTQRRCDTEDKDLQKLFNDIELLYDIAGSVVAFNLLSPIGTKHHEGFFYVHPGLMMDLLIEKYRYVTVRHNYSNDVYTILIYKF